jgi:hypothetical protein
MKTSLLILRPSRFLLVATLAVASVVHAQSSSAATVTDKDVAQRFSDRVVLAKPCVEHRATVDGAEAREGVRVRRTFARFGDVRVIELDGTEAVAAAVARLQATGRYEFVEPSYVQKPYATPNDPSFSSLWRFNNTG